MILLITPEQIFERTQLDNNIDVSKLKPYIEDMQYKYLNTLLGDTLSRKIQDDFNNSTLANSYLEVYNIFVNILIYATASEYILFGQYQVTNGGIFKFNSDRGEVVASNEVEAFAKRYRTKAEIYISELERYLCSESANLPEYSVQDNNYDKRPSHKGSGNGWYF